MKEEIWKDVKGYEWLYQVSNLGRVRSLDRPYVGRNHTGHTHIITKKGRILKPYIQRGYAHVVFSVSNKKKTYKVHRLVAKTFIPNPEEKPQVDHINGIRSDNRVENLRWVTHPENMKNPITKEHLFGHIGHRKKVYQYTLDGELVRTYVSGLSCEEYGYKQVSISAACKGRIKTYKGYRWSYQPL